MSQTPTGTVNRLLFQWTSSGFHTERKSINFRKSDLQHFYQNSWGGKKKSPAGFLGIHFWISNNQLSGISYEQAIPLSQGSTSAISVSAVKLTVYLMDRDLKEEVQVNRVQHRCWVWVPNSSLKWLRCCHFPFFFLCIALVSGFRDRKDQTGERHAQTELFLFFGFFFRLLGSRPGKT